MPDLTVPLDPITLSALESIAQVEGCTVSNLVFDAIRRDLYRRTRAKKADRPDERLIAPLRALLADDLAYARDWDDLRRRLRVKGYELRESGGGLALFSWPGGDKHAKASDLGYSYSRLMQRFGTAFPGHAHGSLADRWR
jgi:hypothetical protein